MICECKRVRAETVTVRICAEEGMRQSRFTACDWLDCTGVRLSTLLVAEAEPLVTRPEKCGDIVSWDVEAFDSNVRIPLGVVCHFLTCARGEADDIRGYR
mgnify:CR=1 FL=1